MAPFTLIIPAHNEEAVIARCLKTALRDAPGDARMEVIVAANGCTDRTVAIARKAAPNAQVLDLAQGSKTLAINAANSAASCDTRIVLDADVECSYGSLAALADALRDEDAMVAAPAIRLEMSHCNAFIKAYYRAWMKQPFAKAGKGGAGCYALSKQALEQIGTFPEIVGDDIWIHTRFPDAQKRFVSEDAAGNPVFSIVRPPASAWQQVKVEARRISGNEVVKREHPSPYFALANPGGGLSGSLRSGASPWDLSVFYAVKLLVRVKRQINRLRNRDTLWARDLSSRQI